MKWVLYGAAVVAFVSAGFAFSETTTVLQESVATTVCLIGATLTGFAVIAGKLDAIREAIVRGRDETY